MHIVASKNLRDDSTDTYMKCIVVQKLTWEDKWCVYGAVVVFLGFDIRWLLERLGIQRLQATMGDRLQGLWLSGDSCPCFKPCGVHHWQTLPWNIVFGNRTTKKKKNWNDSTFEVYLQICIILMGGWISIEYLLIDLYSLVFQPMAPGLGVLLTLPICGHILFGVLFQFIWFE